MLHLSPPNDFLDFFRLLLLGICLYSLMIMLGRYQKNGQNWNIKTKDSWFALLMWTLGGVCFTIQGIALDRPMTPGFVFMTAAILAGGKAVHRKGSWGNREE